MLVNNLRGYLYLSTVSNRGRGGEEVTGLADGREYQCPKCGMFVPPRATTCPFCKSEIEHGATDQESIDEILDELSGLLHIEEEVESEVEAEMKASTDETTGLPKKVPNKKGRTSRRVRRKVIYKKVREKPP